MNIGIINYGVGNLGSVEGALNRAGVQVSLIGKPSEIGNFDKLVLPGVGNFEECSQRLQQGGWFEALQKEVKDGKPIFGICLGMQLLGTSSSEVVLNQSNQNASGLGLIQGTVRHLAELGCSIRVPHIGWNEVSPTLEGLEMFKDIPENSDFYFVHSYALVPDNPNHISAVTNYEIQFVSAIRSGNIWGAQFHPEKSSSAGIRLLKNFIEFDAC